MGLCLREAIHLLMPVAKNNVHLGMLVTVSVTACNRLVSVVINLSDFRKFSNSWLFLSFIN